MGVMNSETLTFRDGTQQWKSEAQSASDYTRYMTPNDDVSLQNFLERPVLIGTYTWTPGVSPFYQVFNPWSLFLGNKRVVNRINNYNLINCKMNVKILINGNPFYYGRLMADYQPLFSLDRVTDFTGLSTLPNIGGSQRLHAYLDPSVSQGATLVLPFVYWDNAVSIPAAGWTNLGRMAIREMTPLKHANGSVTPITINVFAWATDVVLSVPTSLNSSSLVTQASEIDMKPSSIASSAANVAGMLSNVPLIGPYAKATEMVLTKLGGMAKFFGYSRPVIVEEASAMRPALIGELAVVDKKENIQKLTADSRQELTIDPSVVGVSMPDELSVAYIASKESYFTNFAWTIAAVEGTHLWNVRVSPSMYDFSGSSFYTTALAFASLPFRSWRGTIKYRFQIVASQYHKGRLLFQYDPVFVNPNGETNVMYSRVVDLEKERDFTIDIAWGVPAAYLPILGLGARQYSSTIFATSDPYSNGVLAVFVLNNLNSPNSTVNNDISINVFASACDDIDFVEPSASAIRALAWTTQSDEIELENAPTSQVSDECMSKCIDLPDIHSVFYGEAFPSFRALLKRYNFHSSFTSPTTAIGRYTWVLNTPDFPAPRGVVSGGGMNNAGLANYSVTTLLNYLSPAFLCQRGGIRYKYIVHEDASPTASSMYTFRGLTPGFSNALFVRVDTTSDLYMKSLSNGNASYAHNAMAATINQHQPVLEFELPYYRTYRFNAAKDPASSSGFSKGLISDSGHTTTIDTKFNAVTDRTTLDRFVSVSEDFQLSWFQGAPPITAYSIP